MLVRYPVTGGTRSLLLSGNPCSLTFECRGKDSNRSKCLPGTVQVINRDWEAILYSALSFMSLSHRQDGRRSNCSYDKSCDMYLTCFRPRIEPEYPHHSCFPLGTMYNPTQLPPAPIWRSPYSITPRHYGNLRKPASTKSPSNLHSYTGEITCHPIPELIGINLVRACVSIPCRCGPVFPNCPWK